MKTISHEKAKELNENYVKTRSKILEKKIKKKEAVSSWFSWDDIKAYIAYVEEEAQKQGIIVSGLRVYFGAYSKDHKEDRKKNCATVFFVPTEPKQGDKQKECIGDPDNGDITGIDPLNHGSDGTPPFATYPQ